MKRTMRGFTVVELLITLVVMAILLGLAVAAFGNIQAQARDKERASDIDTIARGLEQRYEHGNPVATMPWQAVGAYPGVNEILHAQGYDRTGFDPLQVTGGYLTKLLPGVTKASLTAPNGDQPIIGLICVWACQPAGNAAQVASAFNGQKDVYVYEPIDPDGNICSNGGCNRYNLYWISETDKTVYLGIPGLKVVKSKHQQ